MIQSLRTSESSRRLQLHASCGNKLLPKFVVLLPLNLVSHFFYDATDSHLKA
jgi:hypothetical protein